MWIHFSSRYRFRCGLLLGIMLLCLRGEAQETVWQEFESIGFGRHHHPLVQVTKDGKQYYYHLDSQVLIDETENMAAGMTVGIKDGEYGVIRDDGKLIVPFDYDGVQLSNDYTGQWYEGISYHYKFILLQKAGRYGYADTNGNVLAEPKYDELKVISKHIIAVAENNRWGWLDAETGEVIQPCTYDEVGKTYTFDSYVKIQQDGKFGLARKDGTLVVPIESERLLFFPGTTAASYVLAEKQGVHTVYDSLGQVRLQGNYPGLKAVQHTNLLSYQQHGLMGLLDPASGEVIFEPQFSSMGWRVRELYVVEKDKQYGVVHERGKLLLPLEYDRIEFVGGEGRVRRDAPSIDGGLSYKRGNPKTPEQAERHRFEAKMDSLPYYIRVFKGTQTGIFDWAGNPLVPLRDYEAIVPYYSDRLYFLALHADGKTGILDASGKELLAPGYQHVDIYSYNAGALDTHLDRKRRYLVLMEGMQTETTPAHIGLFDLKTAKMLIPPGPQQITWLDEHYFKVIQREKGDRPDRVILYTRGGEEVLRFDEDVRDVDILENDLLLLEKPKGYRRGVFVLMDMTGNVLYENPSWGTQGSFAHIRFPESKEWNRRDFHGGWKKLYTDETLLFINKKGEEKRFAEYDQVDTFFGGYAVVAKRKATAENDDGLRFGGEPYHFGVIDSTGKEVFPPNWDDVSSYADSPYLLQVRQGEKNGLVDRRGQVVLPVEYEYIETGGRKDYFKVQKDGKLGLIYADGRVVIEPRYDWMGINYNGEEKTWPLLVQEGDWHYFVDKDGKPFTIRGKERK